MGSLGGLPVQKPRLLPWGGGQAEKVTNGPYGRNLLKICRQSVENLSKNLARIQELDIGTIKKKSLMIHEDVIKIMSDRSIDFR